MTKTTNNVIDEILEGYRKFCKEHFTLEPSVLGKGAPAINTRQAKAAITDLINRGKLEEVNGFDTHRHYGKDYQDSMDELAEYKEKRIKELRTLLGEEKK